MIPERLVHKGTAGVLCDLVSTVSKPTRVQNVGMARYLAVVGPKRQEIHKATGLAPPLTVDSMSNLDGSNDTPRTNVPMWSA
jgi:hypothetical protein